MTGVSTGECHNAVRRLRFARLILPDERRPPIEMLHRFLVEGAPFAFPAMVGPMAVGIPTAVSSPVFCGVVESPNGFVWPHPDGIARGQTVVPLFPAATNLVSANTPLYEVLTIIDALRTGSTRIRKLAADLLAERFSVKPK
jgi:hypothetical protein